MIDLGQAVAAPNDRRIALAGAGIMLVPALICAPIAHRQAGASYPLFAIVVSIAIAMMLMSAVLLWAQARVARSRPLLVLAALYASTATTMVPYLLFYRGLWPELAAAVSADPQTSAWLWLEWHMLFAVSPALYIASRRWSPQTGPREFRIFEIRTACIVAGGLALTIPALIWIDGLPPFTIQGAWTPLATAASISVALVSAVSIVALYAQNRFRSVVDLWLGVAALCLLADVLVSRFGAGIFTVGWYVSRGYVLVASGTLLTALILQTANVYAQLARASDRFRDESLTDALTGLANRRSFDVHLAHVVADASRAQRPIALLMIDVDNFKQYNDAFGHPAGDRCLQDVAQAVRDNVPRASDLVARFGGEELAVVLNETEIAGAAIVAERIRAAIERLRLAHAAGSAFDVVTVSIGIAAADNAAGLGAATLLDEADRALYRAKEGGRNRAVAAAALPVSA